MKLSKLAIPLLLIALPLSTLNSLALAAEPGSITGNVYCDEELQY